MYPWGKLTLSIYCVGIQWRSLWLLRVCTSKRYFNICLNANQLDCGVLWAHFVSQTYFLNSEAFNVRIHLSTSACLPYREYSLAVEHITSVWLFLRFFFPDVSQREMTKFRMIRQKHNAILSSNTGKWATYSNPRSASALACFLPYCRVRTHTYSQSTQLG